MAKKGGVLKCPHCSETFRFTGTPWEAFGRRSKHLAKVHPGQSRTKKRAKPTKKQAAKFVKGVGKEIEKQTAIKALSKFSQSQLFMLLVLIKSLLAQRKKKGKAKKKKR